MQTTTGSAAVQASGCATADVIVIGGGPAGCAAALRLARQHFHVVLLERQGVAPSGRDRLRSGEGLIPRTCRELVPLGITARQAPWVLSQIDQVRTVQADGTTSSDLVGRLGGILQIDRLLFEDELRSAAAQAGVDVRLGWRVRRFLCAGTQIAGVVAQPPGSQQECMLRAPIVVDASGRNALSFRHFDLQVPATDNFAAIVMFFDRVAGLESQVWEVHLFGTDALSIVQLSQIEPGIVRCGLGVHAAMPFRAGRRSASLFWSQIGHNAALANRLQGSQPVQRPYVRVGIGYGVRRVTFDGLVLVGDAAGYVNPLFGDGILRALSSARQVAATVGQALRRGDCSRAGLASYERQHALRIRIDRVLLELLAALASRPNLSIRLASVSGIRHGLFAALLR